VNKRVEEDIDYILAHSPTRPIIIVQGDHGSTFTLPDVMTNDAMDEFAKERLPILNAYYVPEPMQAKLRSDITPDNSFRLLFNTCLGEHFEMLPEKHVVGWYPDEQMREVTQVVHPAAAQPTQVLAEKPPASIDTDKPQNR
jgi:hypothetical protein